MNKTIKLNLKKRTKKKTLKKKIELKKYKEYFTSSNKTMSSLNKQIVSVLTELKNVMYMKKKRFSALGYEKSIEKIIKYGKEINSLDEISHLFKPESSTMKHLREYFETGQVTLIKNFENDPVKLFTKIYGVGPKKAAEFKRLGITTLQELKEREDELLTSAQKYGLQYYDDIQKRIPRKEIDAYDKIFKIVFDKIKTEHSEYKIVGSYNRGAETSGDIDVIITDSKNNINVFAKFISALEKLNIIIAILSKGSKKSLTIGRISKRPARRLDFMWSPPKEYPFATLYFTGSMEFNVNMRQRAVDLGLTMNEHSLYYFKNKVKGKKVDGKFKTEEDIFKFLGMVYTPPTERKGPIQFLEKMDTIKKPKIKIKDSTIDLIEDFAISGISKLEQLDEITLANMVRVTTYHYFHKKALISDNTYDILKEYVEKNYPDNPVLSEVGSEIMDKVKVKLPYYMGSMDKIKPDTNAVSNWLLKYNGSYVISGKLDGISAMYSTENGEKKLYTRGKATVGMDISYMIPHLTLPNEPDITIRGELIIQKNKFDKNYADSYKCSRNFVAGTINGKEMAPDKFQDIDFVAYEVIKPEIKPSEQMDWLEQNNVLCVKNINIDEVSNEILSNILVSWRDDYCYEIDGIIITDDKIYERQQKNPKHSFAFKMVLSDQIMESKVVDIHWNPSKYGYLKPRVQIEPILIKGATIEYVTGHNAEFIRKNCIGIGALVKIIRSGDVIPKIQEVIVKAEYPKMPDVEWEWNETNIDAIIKDSSNNQTMIEKEIESFAIKLEIVNLGPGNIKKIVNAGFDSIPKLLKIQVEDLIKIPGFQIKSASKIINSIREQLSEMPLSTLITSINIFARGMGEKRIKIILKAYPNIITSDESIETKFEKVKSLNGFAKKTALAFVEKLPEIVEFLESTELLYKLTEIKETNHDINHPLYQKKIKFSGFRDKEMQKILEEIGAEIQSAISSKTDFVIVEDIDELSDKVRKAQEKNISVISKEQFEKIYI